MIFALASSFAGLVILFFRLWRLLFRVRAAKYDTNATWPRVSIVVPARNEETNLPRLLESLLTLEGPGTEVIVIDDQSRDQTFTIATAFVDRFRLNQKELKVIKSEPRPAGWVGKNWPCHQGFQHATGEFILFTDADTVHAPESLSQAVARMEKNELDLLSAIPYHSAPTLWEKLTGPFHCLLFVSTAAFSTPRLGRVFAIGQYLMFRRASYLAQGGHEAIRGALCDDLELATACLRGGGRYFVESAVSLYRVRMYESLAAFINGWRRNFRLGFRYAHFSSTVEIYFVIASWTASFHFFKASAAEAMCIIWAMAFLALCQRRFGDFSLGGVLLLPFSLGLFVVISLLALYDLVLRKNFVWRGRTYSTRS